jgi:hypothetical protein
MGYRYNIPAQCNSPHGFWEVAKAALSYRGTTWFFAHDIGYHLTLLDAWNEILKPCWSVRHATTEPQCTVLTLSYRGKKLIFCDARNFWPGPLTTLPAWRETWVKGGRKVVFDSEVPSSTGQPEATLVEESIVSLLDTLRRHQLGAFRPTIASQSFETYRHSFMDHRIHIGSDPEVTSLERDGYFGGHADCLKIGPVEGPVYELDVNAMYPYVMSLHSFPTKLTRHVYEPPITGWQGIGDLERCIARVHLRARRAPYPYRTDSGIRYAYGDYHTVLVGEELKQAALRMDIVSCSELAIYKMEPIFETWAKFAYAFRLLSAWEGDRAEADLWKRLANSLYGRFGMKGSRWEDAPDVTPVVEYGTWTYHPPGAGVPVTYRAIAWHVQQRVRKGEAPHSFPAIAAWVTMHARIYMDQLVDVAGERQVYYRDADCLHVTKLGYQRLKASSLIGETQLGKLKIKGVHSAAHYWGVRDYMLGGEHICAGVNGKGKVEASGHVRQTVAPSLNSVLNSGPGNTVPVKTVDSQLQRSTYFGRVDPGGWVIPDRVGD